MSRTEKPDEVADKLRRHDEEGAELAGMREINRIVRGREPVILVLGEKNTRTAGCVVIFADDKQIGCGLADGGVFTAIANVGRRSHPWKCPACGHRMTEDESKGYRSCPSGVHAVAHVNEG